MANNGLSQGELILEPPTYPEDWECCDNGCEELCVYEIYRQQKKAFDEQQRRLNVPNAINQPIK